MNSRPNWTLEEYDPEKISDKFQSEWKTATGFDYWEKYHGQKKISYYETEEEEKEEKRKACLKLQAYIEDCQLTIDRDSSEPLTLEYLLSIDDENIVMGIALQPYYRQNQKHGEQHAIACDKIIKQGGNTFETLELLASQDYEDGYDSIEEYNGRANGLGLLERYKKMAIELGACPAIMQMAEEKMVKEILDNE
mgnify:CR=1 FL=1